MEPAKGVFGYSRASDNTAMLPCVMSSRILPAGIEPLMTMSGGMYLRMLMGRTSACAMMPANAPYQ